MRLVEMAVETVTPHSWSSAANMCSRLKKTTGGQTTSRKMWDRLLSTCKLQMKARMRSEAAG